MGTTMADGLLAAGWRVDQITIAERVAERRAQLVDLGYLVVDSPAAAVAGAETVLLVVKPGDALTVLDEISTALGAAPVISLCAGLPTDLLQEHLPEGTPVVRVMPNTPASIGRGMAAISAGRHADSVHTDLALSIMSAVGSAVVVPESFQDAVTAVSGSGPAYVFYLAEAMIEAGVQLGLPRSIATQLAVETIAGSAELLRSAGEHPAVLRERVTSPGGTTAAAIRELDAHAVRSAVSDALAAAAARSAQLAQEARGRQHS